MAPQVISVRTDVLEYGGMPISPWLSHLNSLVALQALKLRLLQQGTCDQRGRCFVSREDVGLALDASGQQTQVLLDLFSAVADDRSALQVGPTDGDPLAVDVYGLVLYLFVHFYTREAARAETADGWPNGHPADVQIEPSSPMGLTARAWGKEAAPSQAHRSHLPATRQRMQEHLQYQDQLVQGFGVFVARHARELVDLVASPMTGEDDVMGLAGQEDGSSGGGAGATLTPAEFDRLGLLLQTAAAQTRTDAEGGSPMDVCGPSPFGQQQRGTKISDAVPLFTGEATARDAHELAAWLQDALRTGAEAEAADYMLGTSPPRQSMFNQLAPAAPALCSPSDIVGLHRATAVRGVDDLGSGRVRVLDCHDAVIYCLAPLQYVTVSCCSDCVVVVGAVGRALRLERCERVQVVAATASAAVNTCHDCILYLGTNRPPVLLGDNRFVQLAPHNAGYECLPEHMALAGVQPHPNAWASPVALHKEHPQPKAGSHLLSTPPPSPMQASQLTGMGGTPQTGGSSAAVDSLDATAAAGGRLPEDAAAHSPTPAASSPSGPGGASAAPPPPVTLLPPAKLMPFLVPFRGATGAFCGGATKTNPSLPASAMEDSVSGFLLVGDSAASSFAPNPFPLPAEYAEAWEQKMAGVAAVRAAYRSAQLDEAGKREFLAGIQVHFKEWLHNSGGMREVYDLARLERETAAGAEAEQVPGM